MPKKLVSISVWRRAAAAAMFATLSGYAATSSGLAASILRQHVAPSVWSSFPLPPGESGRTPDLSSRPVPEVRGFISPKVKEPGGAVAFISDYYNSVVYIINAAGQTTGTLGGFFFPYGLAVDKRGDLYVADPGNQRIQLYAPPYSGSPTTLHDPGQYPVDVAIDRNGNVAASNAYGPKNSHPSVTFYAAGSTNPALTLSIPSPASVSYFCAFDALGNLYLDGHEDSVNRPFVGEVVGGISGTAVTLLSLTAHDVAELSLPTGLQVATNGSLVIASPNNHSMYTFNPPVGGALGDPVQTTVLAGFEQPQGFAFTPNNAQALLVSGTAAYLITYPGGVTVKHITLRSNGYLRGAAINPTESY